MKLTLALFALLALAPAARAETLAFVDTGRVYAESTEWQRLSGELQSDDQAKKAEVSAAVAAFQKAQAAKAKPAELQALQQKAITLNKMDSDDLAKHEKESRAAFRKHLSDVTAKLEAERHVKVLGAAPLVEDKRDLTDEVIKRLNDSDVVTLAAKVAAFEAEKTKAAAPVATKTEKK